MRARLAFTLLVCSSLLFSLGATGHTAATASAAGGAGLDPAGVASIFAGLGVMGAYVGLRSRRRR